MHQAAPTADITYPETTNPGLLDGGGSGGVGGTGGVMGVALYAIAGGSM